MKLASNQEPQPNRSKVLIVDDDPVSQWVLSRQLEFMGYEADCVSSGKVALSLLERKDYALIFMDYQMPGLDGVETTARIRAMESAGGKAPVPVVLVTSHPIEPILDQCPAVGIVEYLKKPVLKSLLEGVLQRYAQNLPSEAQ